MEVTLAQPQYDALVSSAHQWATLGAQAGSTVIVLLFALLGAVLLLCGLILAVIFTRRWF